MSSPANSGGSKATQWKPGQSGNPAGKTKGARTRWSDAFFQDMADEWQEGGVEAIRYARLNDPSTYLRVCASLMPKQVEATSADDFDELTDEDLVRIIGIAHARIGNHGREGAQNARAPRKGKQAKSVPPVH